MKIGIINENNYPEVARIYAEGISTGVATFETTVPTWENWDRTHFSMGRVLAVQEDKILGWGALTPVSDRCVYGGVAEVSVYVSEDTRGQGVGKFILDELIKISEENGIWTLQSGIFIENTSSISLHSRCGFRTIGYRERIGQLHGKWYDNVIMERRSKKIGV